MLALASSRLTVALRASRSTLIARTPATFSSAFFTVMGQAAQFIPGTDGVTVQVAANPVIGTGPARARTRRADGRA